MPASTTPWFKAVNIAQSTLRMPIAWRSHW